MERLVRKLDAGFDCLLLLVFLVLFLAGGYSVYDSWLVYAGANDDSLLAYKPGYEGDRPPEKALEGRMAGWITIDGTDVDYPVMQGKDNTEYLNRNPYGEYSLSGSIFLDYRNDTGFSDAYSLVYGHHMAHGSMFGALDAYWDEGFFRSHQSGSVLLPDGTRLPFRVFAVLDTDASESLVFVPGDGEGTLLYVRDHAVYLGDVPPGDKRLLALSTCKYPDTAERTVVFAYFE